jgi:hypothetical protein
MGQDLTATTTGNKGVDIAPANGLNRKQPSPGREIFADRVTWAVSEVARLAAPEGLLDSDLCPTKQPKEFISRFMPVHTHRRQFSWQSSNPWNVLRHAQ